MTYAQLFPERKERKQDTSRFTLESINPTQLDQKWKWNQFIETFVKELNMRVPEVYEMNYISALNWYAYFMDRDKVRENIMKQR